MNILVHGLESVLGNNQSSECEDRKKVKCVDETTAF